MLLSAEFHFALRCLSELVFISITIFTLRCELLSNLPAAKVEGISSSAASFFEITRLKAPIDMALRLDSDNGYDLYSRVPILYTLTRRFSEPELCWLACGCPGREGSGGFLTTMCKSAHHMTSM